MKNIIFTARNFIANHKKLFISTILIVTFLMASGFYYYPHILIKAFFRESKYPQLYAQFLPRDINYPSPNNTEVSKGIYAFRNLSFQLPTNNFVEEIDFNEQAEIIQPSENSIQSSMKQLKFDGKKVLFAFQWQSSTLDLMNNATLEVLHKPIAQDPASQWLFGENNLKSDYLLQKHLFEVNPDQINVFTPRKEAIKKMLLLNYKITQTMLGASEKYIYNFQTPFIKGFQFGNTPKNGNGIEFYDNSDNRFYLGSVGLNQDEIDTILSSIKNK